MDELPYGKWQEDRPAQDQTPITYLGSYCEQCRRSRENNRPVQAQWLFRLVAHAVTSRVLPRRQPSFGQAVMTSHANGPQAKTKRPICKSGCIP